MFSWRGITIQQQGEFETLRGIDSTSKVYFLQENAAGYYEIYFGDGVTGFKPTNNNIVTIDYVTTQGKESKFGSTIEQILNMQKILVTYNINIIGLHTHQGSGVHNYKKWINIANILMSYSKFFSHLKWINIGGGFGVSKHIDLINLNIELKKIKDVFNIEIWTEPGRYFVSTGGILVGNITQIKYKSGVKFIGTNIGMSNLIRPMLYDAKHPIYNISSKNKKMEKACLVGPICESGDILDRNIMLPVDTKIGDIIVITQAGAYGYSMSSNYNLLNTFEITIKNDISNTASALIK